MEALFIENTSQAIKDYFYKNHESAATTTTQRTSNRDNYDYKPSQNMYTQDCQYTIDDMTNNDLQNNEEGGDTVITSTTDQRDDGFEFVISEAEDKLPTAEDNPRYTTFSVNNGCGMFNTLPLAKWGLLTSIFIGDGCCLKCEMFSVNSCPELKMINIGDNSLIKAECVIEGNSRVFLITRMPSSGDNLFWF